MKLTIYRPNGTAIFDIIPDTSSGHDWSLMTDNRLSISFELERCMVLLPGYYVDFDGIRYYIIEEYKPTLVNSTQWKYNVTLKDAASWLAITVALNMIDGKNTPIFQYTATAAEHAAIIVNNLNRRMGTLAWKVGSVIETGNISIDYSGKYCSDVLQEIVDGEGTEWWVDGMTLNIGRAEFGDPIVLGYRQGLLGNITCAQADNIRSYAYLFPVGSTRNIDPTKYGYDRLQLPNGQTRVDMNVEQGVAELVEEKAFSHIFPRYIGKVTSVSTSTGTSEDGTPFLIYFIEDKNIPFNPNEYELPGAVKHIIFQSGELMGVDFEVNYNAATHEFEIITQWPNGGGQLPGGVLVPKVGDEYVVWNITMPNEYYSRASQEFLEAAQAFAKSAVKDVSVYKAQLDYIDVQERGLKVRPGQRVRLLSNEFFSSGYYDSRITRITRKLDIPDAVNIDVSAVRVVGTIQKLQNSLQSTVSQVAQVTNTVQTVVQTVTNAVTLTGNQRVKGVKNFVDGIKVCDSPILSYDPKTKSWLLEGNLIVTGGGAFRAALGDLDVPTIMDAVVADEQSISNTGKTLKVLWSNLPIDDKTIKRNADGTLYAIGGGSGGGSAEVTYSSVISALGYTPLSTAGGTVTATGGRQLSLQSSTDAQAALWLGTGIEQFSKGGFLQYDYSNGSIALVNFLAMANSYTGLAGLFIKRDNRITVGDANLSVEYDVLHSGNYANYALPVTGGTVKGNSRFVMMRNGDHSSIIPEVTALTISTNSASYTGYNTGIGFNALGDYGSLTYKNHIHAWIGLGGATTTAEAECYPLVFATNGSTSTGASPIERMRINPDGQVIVTGDTLLGSINLQYSDEINRYGGNLYIQHRNGDGTGHVVMCYNGGNVGIGVAYPSEKLQVLGNFLATGGITARYTSDRRLKHNIRPFRASEMLMSLGGVWQFEYIDSEVEKNHIYGGSHIGLIYQNVVGSALDRMCYERQDGYGSLNYLEPSFISLIAGATMEHTSEIEQLKKRVKLLEARM